MENNLLRNKKVLITAGPTWIPVDDVRVLSNISTGQLGLLLAEEALKYCCKTDLFLGPVVGNIVLSKLLKVSRFFYFDELLNLIKKTLAVKQYDIIIHCVAASDYVCCKVTGKISSEKETLNLKLKKAPKLIHFIKQLNPQALLVMFKLESRVQEAELIKRAGMALKRAQADMVVANYFKGAAYQGLIVDNQGKIVSRASSKIKLAKNLFDVLKKRVK